MSENLEILCPCGSKRYVSQCHGLAQGWMGKSPELARVSLYTRLINYAAQARFGELWDLTKQQFFGDCLDALPEEHADVLLESKIAKFNFTSYLTLHVGLQDGDTIAMRFLAEHGAVLAGAEREFLNNLLRVRPMLYEVADVEAGSSLTLLDPYTDATCTVTENYWSSTLREGDLLSARLIPKPNFKGSSLEDVQVAFPADLRETVLEDSEDLIESLHHASETSWPALGAKLTSHLHQIWISSMLVHVVEREDGPSEADPFTCQLRFEVREPEKLLRLFKRTPGVSIRKDQKWNWNHQIYDGIQDTSGIMTLHDQWLIAEVANRNVADALEIFLEQGLADGICLRSAEYTDPPHAAALARIRSFRLLSDEGEESA